MNTTTRTALRLLVATPLAASAIAFGAGVAQADGFDPDGPIIIANPEQEGPGDIANPEPEPQPDPPAPEDDGPGDKGAPNGGGDPEPNPEVPDDKGAPNGGDPEPIPDGPDDITNPDDGGPDGPDDFTNPEPGDEPEDKPADKGDKGGKGDKGKGDKDVDVVNTGGLIAEEVPVPTRIDAGAASATEEEQGLELMWVLAGGGVVTAAGAAFARQRLARR